MTRPAPTVTVPVEPTEAMKIAGVHAIDNVLPNDVSMWVTACWSAMLAAAPAAPQAAGVGELTNEQIQTVMVEAIKEVRETVTDNVERAIMDADVARMERGPVDMGTTGWEVMRAVHRRLAALRAPSREPEGGAAKLVGTIAHVSHGRTELPELIASALATREEAPDWTARTESAWAENNREEATAEAGEREAIARIIAPHTFDLIASYTSIDRGDGLTHDQREPSVLKAYPPTLETDRDQALAKADAILALRAHPQAREDAQPVAESVRSKWISDARDFAERMTSQPAACEIIERLLEIITHPAPDALRVAVEASKFLLDRLRDLEWDVNERDFNGHVLPAASRLRQALAALQAEQGAK